MLDWTKLFSQLYTFSNVIKRLFSVFKGKTDFELQIQGEDPLTVQKIPSSTALKK